MAGFAWSGWTVLMAGDKSHCFLRFGRHPAAMKGVT
jgi:hypothetical protein